MMDPARLESLRVMRKKYTFNNSRSFLRFSVSIQKSFSYNILLFFYTLASHFLHNIWSNLYVFPGSIYICKHKKVVHNFQHYIFFGIFFITLSLPVVLGWNVFPHFSFRHIVDSPLFTAYMSICVFNLAFSSYDFIISVRRKNRYSINILTHWLVELISIVIWCFDCYHFCLLDGFFVLLIRRLFNEWMLTQLFRECNIKMKLRYDINLTSCRFIDEKYHWNKFFYWIFKLAFNRFVNSWHVNSLKK